MTTSTYVDFPSPIHNGATSFSFADGHSEQHRWINLGGGGGGGIPAAVTYVGLNTSGRNTPGNPDVYWLQSKSSSK